MLRTIAIIIEVLIIGAVFYHILAGVRILLLEVGVKAKHSKIITLALLAVGTLLGTFFISHLITFYPTV
ncbi:MAG: hypothetical protein KAT75_02750 [Dehalococcoidia bacterium]|nr:hypothetical protein [Dehalococcoidia bacterium]